MRNCPSFLAAAAVATTLGAALAAWPTDPAVNVPLCTALNSQINIAVAPDGKGGVLLAWQDSRGADTDVYAHRMDAGGTALWTVGGVAVCTLERAQWEPAIVADGAGGSIVVWEDRRGGGAPDIYAQHLDDAGAPLWTTGGSAVSTTSDSEEDPCAVPDGTGGAIVVWAADRPGGESVLVAQRVDPAGNLTWGASGVPVCAAAGDQYDAEIVTDEAGGAIVVWQDDRSAEIYLQRVLPDGTPHWTAQGIPLTSAGGYSSEHAIARDGAGGVVVAFTDDRNGSDDIFVQRFDADGIALWAADGVAVCTDAASQDDAAVCSDGDGGAIVVWEDGRGPDRDLYAQRVDSRGDVMWQLDGVRVCDEAEMQATAEIVADGEGGAIVVWRDWRDFRQKVGEDLYAQRLDATGDRLWATAGFPVSTADGAQQAPRALPAEVGAAFVVWEDRRDERTSQQKEDVFAQRIDGEGGAEPPAPLTCSIGSTVVLAGEGFGTRRPAAYVLYEKKPGKQRSVRLKVTAWTDTTVDATWTKKLPPAAYPVWVKPKSGVPVEVGALTLVAPAPDPGLLLSGAPKSRLTLAGAHFGTRTGRLFAEYVNQKGKLRRKRCKVVKKTWRMDPADGASSVDFLVPKLAPGTYDLIVANKLGEARAELVVE